MLVALSLEDRATCNFRTGEGGRIGTVVVVVTVVIPLVVCLDSLVF